MNKPSRPGTYFSWYELTRTGTGLPNEPTSQAVIDNLVLLCSTVLDPLREAIGPVLVTSGYRSLAVNTKVGGSPTSAHTQGLAADIKSSSLTSLQIAQRIVELGLPFDQVIHYDRARGGHLHVGLPRVGSRARRQILHAPAGASGYRTSSLQVDT